MDKCTASTAFPLPSFAYAFLDAAPGLALWAYWRNSGSAEQALSAAAAQVAALRGCTRQQAYSTLRQGNGRYWRIRAGQVRLYGYRHLWGVACNRVGVGKHSWINCPKELLSQGVGHLRAFMCIPVLARTQEEGTPRAYTAKCARVSLKTVSAYRARMDAARHIVIMPPQYRPALLDRLGRPESGAFFDTRTGYWKHRLPDVIKVSCKVLVTHKPLKGNSTNTRTASAGRAKRSYLISLRYRILKVLRAVKGISRGQHLQRYGPALKKLLGSAKWKRIERLLLLGDRDEEPVAMARRELEQAAARLARYAPS